MTTAELEAALTESFGHKPTDEEIRAVVCAHTGCERCMDEECQERVAPYDIHDGHVSAHGPRGWHGRATTGHTEG